MRIRVTAAFALAVLLLTFLTLPSASRITETEPTESHIDVREVRRQRQRQIERHLGFQEVDDYQRRKELEEERRKIRQQNQQGAHDESIPVENETSDSDPAHHNLGDWDGGLIDSTADTPKTEVRMQAAMGIAGEAGPQYTNERNRDVRRQRLVNYLKHAFSTRKKTKHELGEEQEL
jgi:hypothetical protein